MRVGRAWSQWGSAFLCLFLIALWAARPLGVQPPAHVASDFDDRRALARLATILGDERPHPVDSEANDAVRARLLEQIAALGFTPELRDRFHCNDIRQGAAICARVRNILFWVTPPGKDAVMLAAHYDSVPAGPGASDDGMGVASALEVARLLRQERPARPVLVALTDGEEAGLVGAAQFAANDPLAGSIGAVVNLEARGTSGSANMFQTSTPNGRDVAALAAGGLTPSANAIATDLYALMPNDTDLTMLLPLGVDAANYAVIGSASRYHTPLDDLAHLDRRSFRHMGASALSATRGFARAEGRRGEPEGQLVFTDIGKRIFLVLPRAGAAILLSLGLIAAILLQTRPGAGSRIRTALAPPLALLVGVGLAIALGIGIAALRPEAGFATAWPIALRTALAAAALLGASLMLRLMRVEDGVRLAAAGWAWLTALLLVLFAPVPGLATLAAWSAVPLALAAAASFHPRTRPAAPWLLAAAAILFALVALPVAGGAEDGLFAENSAPLVALLVFLFLFLMPLARPRPWLAPAACGVVLLAAAIAALLVPAYAPDAPRALSVMHRDEGGKAAFLIYDNGPLPPAMAKAASFAPAPDAEGYWRAPAPPLADGGRFAILSDTVAGKERTVRFLAEDPLADRQEFHLRHGEGVRRITVNGAQPAVKPPLAYIVCSGRACRTLDVTLVLDAAAPLPELSWRRHFYGAGPAAAALVAARPADARPIQDGDTRSLVRELRLPPATGSAR